MARTQAADYEDRREAVVEHAADLFAKLGFPSASIADLAKACNYSKSLIYYYYPSKEEILYAVMSSHIDLLLREVEEVTRANKPAAEALAELVHRFMRDYVGAASRQKVLLNELGSLPEDKRRIIVGKQRSIIEAVEGLVIAVHPGLAADPAKARLKTMLLFGMINWTHTWFHPDGPLSAEDVADMVNDMMDLGDRGRSAR